MYLFCLLVALAVLYSEVNGACSDITIVSRSQWGARSRSLSTMSTPVLRVFIHHTVTSRCSSQTACASVLRGIQNYHIDNRGWRDIGYSFLIGDDGKAYEGRGWDKQGAHTSGFNSVSLGISLMGNFETATPSSAMMTAVQNLISCGVERGYISSNYRLQGHRDVSSTPCPGRSVYSIIRGWSHYRA